MKASGWIVISCFALFEYVIQWEVIVNLILLSLALTPQERAVAYLSQEVPKWRGANGCFSCHNNGDGARALYRAGVDARGIVLAETSAWLEKPELWESNRGNPAVSDKKLAKIQFGVALLALGNKTAVCSAAGLIVAERGTNGAWKVDDGSPATYGTVLATVFARNVLMACGMDTSLTVKWLAAQKPKSVLDSAALLMADSNRNDARSYLLQAQNSDGGWGEYQGMPAQVFDTAVAVIALRGAEKEVARGRAWLVSKQQEEGGWPETTRPPGAQSYAQHISTTAWALLALLG